MGRTFHGERPRAWFTSRYEALVKEHGRQRHPLVSNVVIATVIATLWPVVVSAQDTTFRYDDLLDPGWSRIGGFKGAAGATLLGRVNDLLFEQEATGTLYRDLGDVTLGLSWDPDRGEIRWDNSFYRRVLPLHREIEPGGLVTGDDLSSYLDIKTLISRGRARWDAITPLLGDEGAIGMQVEGGVSLSLGRIHPALDLGERTLEEALADPDRGIEKLTQEWPEGHSKSLLRMATEGAAGLTQWIADTIGRKTIDTERSAIFYESYGDTVSLFIDVGLPVEAEPFTERDPRLGPGDFVRQVTFVGLSPIGLGINVYGVEASFQHFYRYLRETTIVKEAGGTVLVQVRTGMAKGDETTPLKVRPELRLLGVLTLGYTFFEQVYTIGTSDSYEAVFRIDLEDPRGMACFREILGDGGRPRMRPLAEAAVERDGAEKLADEVRRGHNRSALRRFRCFSLFNFRRWRVASSDVIETEDGLMQEMVLANTWSTRKRIGRDRDYARQLLIRALGDIPEQGVDTATTGNGDVAAVTLITGIRREFADGKDVRRAAHILRRTLDWDDHPLLDELAEVDPGLDTRLAMNLRLSLDAEHVDRIVAATEDEVWTELAEVLLGDPGRTAWGSSEQRKEWKRAVRTSRGNPGKQVAGDAIEPREKPLSAKARYRLARRSVKHFGRLQRLAREGDCLSCLTRAFRKRENVNMMQLLLSRIGSGNGDRQIAYQYEVFIDEMLRPVTVANDVALDLPIRHEISETLRDAVIGERAVALEGEAAAHDLTLKRTGWQGDRFLEPAPSRLNGGEVLLNTGAEAVAGAPAPPCWMLRLYSDVRFDQLLTLRVDLRLSGRVKADIPIGHTQFAMGEPTEVIQTPFMSARFSYDIPLPAAKQLEEGEEYTLLLRMLNADGLPVSEEQQVKLEWPIGGLAAAAPGCYVPSIAEEE
jgi:hypothetical protein